MQDLVVGLDASTSATKAIAWDRHGTLIAEGRAPLALANPHPDWFEQDPADWWQSAATALRQLTAQVDAARIAGVAIANQRETFALVSAGGEALRPGLIWLDSRAAGQVRRFGERFDVARVHEISGRPVDISPCLYRFLWLQEHEPDMFGRADLIADVHGYLSFRLTGRWITSTAAADPMGLLDMRRTDWSDELLAASGVARAMLLPLARPGALLGQISAAAAAATGLAAGTKLFAGGGDGQCAGTGVAVQQPGRAYVNLGTAVVAGMYSAHYTHDRAFRTETAIAEQGYICETSLRSGTFLVDWLAREMLGIEPAARAAAMAALEAEAAASPIGAGGLIVLPYWQGSMTPHWDNGARGVIAGLSGSTRRGDVFRAVLEGIALDLAHTASRVAAANGSEIDHFVAIGGGAASDLWLQIIADATATPVRRSTTGEASSLGAAMAAASGAGWYPGIAAASSAMASPTARTFTPTPAHSARYASLQTLHDRLWPLLSQWNRELRAFAEDNPHQPG